MSKRNAWGLALLGPSLFLLLLFYVIPIGYSIYLSLHDVGFVKDTWIGLQNYRDLVSTSGFGAALRVSGKFVIVYLFCSLIVAYAIGLMLSRLSDRLCGIFLTLFYIATLFSGLVVVAVWRWFYRYPEGGLNSLLDSLHLKPFPWLGNPTTAPWAIAFIMTNLIAGALVILYVAAIGQIDRELLEAAKIDGASELQIIWHIITPLTHRVRLYILLISFIAALGIWEHPFFYTGGGPLGSTTTVMFKVYKTALIEGNIGLGSAMTVVGTFIILILSVFIVRYFREFLG